MIILILFIAFIWGTVDYIRVPKPPKGLSNKELKYYYNGGWKEYEAQKQINAQLLLAAQQETEKAKTNIEKEIEFLTAQIAMLEDLERLIEKDIQKGNGSEKVNLSRLISLDKQIHTAQKKIDKLYNELESL